MINLPKPGELFILTADHQMQQTVETLLNHRCRQLGIRPISFEVRRHNHRDPGCRTESVAYLRQIRNDFGKAMVLFDFAGCGVTDTDAAGLETDLELQLERNGWNLDDISVVVIEPELEAWLFGGSMSSLEQTVGWRDSRPLRAWLAGNGHWVEGAGKPADPKRAVEAVLTSTHRPLNGKLFREVARSVNFRRCRDRAFRKFCATLQRWFPDT